MARAPPKKKDAASGSDSGPQLEDLQLLPIGQDLKRKRYWVVDGKHLPTVISDVFFLASSLPHSLMAILVQIPLVFIRPQTHGKRVRPWKLSVPRKWNTNLPLPSFELSLLRILVPERSVPRMN